jgi:predicted DNA-binding WGR domain protein
VEGEPGSFLTVRVVYGRIGTKGSAAKPKTFTNVAAAQDFLEKLLRDKLKKGYQQRSLAWVEEMWGGWLPILPRQGMTPMQVEQKRAQLAELLRTAGITPEIALEAMGEEISEASRQFITQAVKDVMEETSMVPAPLRRARNIEEEEWWRERRAFQARNRKPPSRQPSAVQKRGGRVLDFTEED